MTNSIHPLNGIKLCRWLPAPLAQGRPRAIRSESTGRDQEEKKLDVENDKLKLDPPTSRRSTLFDLISFPFSYR